MEVGVRLADGTGLLWLCSLFFFSGYAVHRDLNFLTHSFPTLRSSDLSSFWRAGRSIVPSPRSSMPVPRASRPSSTRPRGCVTRRSSSCRNISASSRSEEHTSELQSLMRISYAVFCLKKKKKQQRPSIYHVHSRSSPYSLNTSTK